MANHVKELEFKKNGYTYSLEIDAEDPLNLVIESVTTIGGPIDSDVDVDPDEFEDTLDDDDWVTIQETLTAQESNK